MLNSLVSLTIVEDQVALHLNSDVWMSCLVNDKAIDTIFICDVVIQCESAFVFDITSDINTRAVNDTALVPSTILTMYGMTMSWHVDNEERHKIAIAIHNILLDAVSTGAKRLSEYNGTLCTDSPPCVAIDGILIDPNVI